MFKKNNLVCLIYYLFIQKTLVIHCLNYDTKLSTIEDSGIYRRKCCPNNEVLLKNFILNEYTCSQSNVLLDNISRVNYIHKVLTDNESHLLQCNDSWRCLDYFNNDVIELYCDGSVETKFLVKNKHIKLIKKCCGLYESYNFTDRKCDTDTENSLMKILDHFNQTIIIAYDQFSNCEINEVVVEYTFYKHDIFFIDGIPYFNPSKNLTFDTDSDCFDILNQSIANDNDFWIIRSCKPKSICDEIPCVRKCCPDGAIYKVENGTSECMASKRTIRPELYDLKKSLARIAATETINISKGKIMYNINAL